MKRADLSNQLFQFFRRTTLEEFLSEFVSSGPFRLSVVLFPDLALERDVLALDRPGALGLLAFEDAGEGRRQVEEGDLQEFKVPGAGRNTWVWRTINSRCSSWGRSRDSRIFLCQ